MIKLIITIHYYIIVNSSYNNSIQTEFIFAKLINYYYSRSVSATYKAVSTDVNSLIHELTMSNNVAHTRAAGIVNRVAVVWAVGPGNSCSPDTSKLGVTVATVFKTAKLPLPPYLHPSKIFPLTVDNLMYPQYWQQTNICIKLMGEISSTYNTVY